MRQISSVQVALSGLLTLAVAMGIGRFAFTPLLPMMGKDTGLSLARGGWLAAANYLGYFLGALSAIRLRIAPSRIVLGSLLAIGGLTAAMGVTDDQAAWLILRGLAGVASAWALIFASVWGLQVLAAAGAPRLTGVMYAGVGFGIALTGILCVVFFGLAWSSAQVWIALGAIAWLLAFIAAPGFRAAPPPAPAAAHSPAAPPAPRGPPAAPRLVIAYSLFGFGYIIPATFLPAMARRLSADPALFGWAWPLFGLAALGSTLIAGRLLRRFSNRTLWGTSHLIMGTGVVIPVVLPDLPGIALSAICVGGTFMVITFAAMQEARRVVPAHPARLMAQLTAAFAIGQILGPLLVSLLPQGPHTLDALLGVAATLLMLSGIALLRAQQLPAS